MAHCCIPKPGLDPAVRKAPCPLRNTFAKVAKVNLEFLAFLTRMALVVLDNGFLFVAKSDPPVDQ